LTKNTMKRRWYWYLSLVAPIMLSGLPVAAFKSVGYLIEGLPKHAVAELAYVPINWVSWFSVTIPTRLEESLFIGILILLSTLAIPIVCILLMYKGRKERTNGTI